VVLRLSVTDKLFVIDYPASGYFCVDSFGEIAENTLFLLIEMN
jgi:hypothetical protein